MRNNYFKMLLLLGLLIITSPGWSAITDYVFSSSIGTYTQLAGGNVLGTAANDNEVFQALPLGFDFTYNSILYSTISISCNGFIAMGNTVATSNTAISSGTTNNVIVAMNRDIKSHPTGTLTTHNYGIAPNRVFVVQWHDYRRVQTATAIDTLNFQIKLFETTNIITYNYGYIAAATSSLNQNFQVGLRGASSAEFINRVTTTDWAATTAGTVNTQACVLSSTVFPPNGLTFTWSPPQIGTPPNPAVLVSPANNATNIALIATLNWATGGGTITGYKVYLGTDNPPTNLVNGFIQTATSYDPTPDFAFNTLYYWQIVPFNTYGDALNCPVWSFTSMPNPTVTSFPYHQYWDNVTAPAVPPSWTIVNANNDAFTWTTSNTSSFSAPNVLRCSFNTASPIPMDDWAISPPLVLAADSTYRIQFRYKAQNVNFPEKLEIKWGNANNISALTEQIYLNESVMNTGYEAGEAFITPDVNGTYFFGFHGFSAANMYYLFIDDVDIVKIIPVFNPPQNLAAITGNGTVTLNWQPPEPAGPILRGYHIFRNGVQITSDLVMALNYTDNTAIVGTSYSYNVVAIYVSPNGISVPSNTITITPAFDPPTNLHAAGGTDLVSLSWSPPTNGIPAAYKVFRDGEEITLNPITALIFEDSDVSVGFERVYHVTAIYINPNGESGPSNSVIAEPLNPPTNLSATPGNAAVALNWISPFVARTTEYNQVLTRELLGFKVYRDTTLIATLNNSSQESYTDSNLLPGTYYYYVKAVYTTGESVPSNTASAQVTDAFLSPTNLVAVGSVLGILLTWNPPSPLLTNFSGYRLFKDGIAVGHGLIADSTYFDTAIIGGVDYTYWVVAVYTNPTGVSLPSNSVVAHGGEDLYPVTNLSYTVVQDNVSLAWTPPGGPILQDWIHFDDNFNYDGIGTNGVINFDIAARFTQTELSGIPDRYLTKVRFFPKEVNCVYTVKVWTGGVSSTNPGNLVVQVPVPTPTIDAWNEVTLPTPIQVPSTGEMWVGVNIDTQAGYPAGCDDGPSIPYKGNMIYTNGAWAILTDLGTTLDYNWNIQAFVTNNILRETQLVHIPEPVHAPTITAVNTAEFKTSGNPNTEIINTSRNGDRRLSGYKVYRDGINIATIDTAIISVYEDTELPNGNYTYTVTALYSSGESPHCDPVTVQIDYNPVPTAWQDTFENHDNFALEMYPWILNDLDGSATTGVTGIDFTNEASPMSFMVFNPSATTPPMTTVAAHGGQKMAACFAATTPPNNDWMLTPRMRMGTQNQISLWVKSFTEQYGLERFRVGLSTATDPIPSSFTWLSGPNYVEAPVNWTRFEYLVPSAFNLAYVRFGIKCESNDAFIFFVDDVKVQGYNIVDNDDEIMPVIETALLGNYPNPFNPETSISFNVKSDEQVSIEIYNLKGQKIKTLVNDKVKAGNHKVIWKGDDDNGKPAASGVYFYRMKSGRYTSSRKMILLK